MTYASHHWYPSSLAPYLTHCQVQFILPLTYFSNLFASLYLPLVHLKLLPPWSGPLQKLLALSALACLQIHFSHYFHSCLFEMRFKHYYDLGLPVIALWMKTKLFTMAFKGLQNLGPAHFSYRGLMDFCSINSLDFFLFPAFPILLPNTEPLQKLPFSA